MTTNQVGVQGNIQVSAQAAYPEGSTYDANSVNGNSGAQDNIVAQQPITVAANDVHVVQSTPTLVGQITPVAAEPYNITYRLSQDASFYLSISAPPNPPFRTVVPGLPRPGEGVPNGTLTDGDAWNGRDNNGQIMPPGVFSAILQSFSSDQYGADLSYPTTVQLSMDPLQITDIQVQPLLGGSTSLAVLTYTLTEPATVYVDIYPPGTTFCNGLNNVNSGTLDSASGPPKNFAPSSTPCASPSAVSPVQRFSVSQISRSPVVTFWDGLNGSQQVMPDGDYVFAIYANLPSQEGFPFCNNGTTCTTGSPGDNRIWTSIAKTGFIPIARGYVGVSQISPITTVVGSSPPVAGINPFTFDYSLSREANVRFQIFNSNGGLVKTLVNNEVRPGNTGISEVWSDGVGDNGSVVSSGVYMAQLQASDPFVPAEVTTTTVLFPVDLFRITDINTVPLLVGTTGDFAYFSYQLSNGMNVSWNIYPPGTVFKNQNTDWPPCGQVVGGTCADVVGPNLTTPVSPIISIYGFRAGRLKVTESWNGNDINGLAVPDGNYVYDFIAQSTATQIISTSPVVTAVPFATDRIQGNLAVQRGYIGFPVFSVTPTIPQLFNSSATATVQLSPYTINYSLTRASSVTIQVLNTNLPPQVIRTVFAGQERNGGVAVSDVWDGLDNFGNFLPPGFYTVEVLAEDIASENSQLSLSTAEATVAYQPVQIYDEAASIMDAGHPSGTVFYQVSEPMTVAVKIYKPGTVFDPFGNPTPPASVSLVKLLVGVKPARTEIQDVWDGTDLSFSKVPDGNYEFTIQGSTATNGIDPVTGNVLVPSSLALNYQPFGEIPVVRGASSNPQGDFDSNTFVYPNPVPGGAASATFHIYLPVQGVAHIRIFNIAGELVFTQDFPNQAPSYDAGPLLYVWNKDNQSGRRVARGIYYAVIREEETLGGASIYQTVKKILLQ
ncbi:MAG: FlgD immunoglobulin-like domain containing protein [Elusimicrobiota bacterium]